MAPIISKYQSFFRQCIITFFFVSTTDYAGENLIMNKTNASNLHLNDWLCSCFFFRFLIFLTRIFFICLLKGSFFIKSIRKSNIALHIRLRMSGNRYQIKRTVFKSRRSKGLEMTANLMVCIQSKSP